MEQNNQTIDNTLTSLKSGDEMFIGIIYVLESRYDEEKWFGLKKHIKPFPNYKTWLNQKYKELEEKGEI